MNNNKILCILCTLILGLISAPKVHATESKAVWMEGKVGVGFRINADRKDNIENYDVDTLVNQIKTIDGISYVIFNLSDAAHGDAYLAPHSILTTLNPDSTPNADRDLFGELAKAFHAAGIKVIAYAATQGPAMLKHGAAYAFDGVQDANGHWSSKSMTNWAKWVTNKYGSASDDNYKKAYAEVIIAEYAQRYGSLIDGWWFDHSSCANIPLLHKITKAANPAVILAFNKGQKVPLINNNPGYEDYTSGHPTPLRRSTVSNDINLPMVESIEASSNGYVDDGAGHKSLGHMFMPLGNTWNSGLSVWPLSKAVDWITRVNNACGAWTWNVATQDTNSKLADHAITFMNDVTAKIISNGGTRCTVTIDPSGQALSDGTAITITNKLAEKLTFYYDLDVEASELTIATSGGSGDGDLYVKLGTAPTTADYDCRPFKNNNQETCLYSSPQAGRYHVMVDGSTVTSGVSLIAKVTIAPKELVKGAAITIAGKLGSEQYYYYDLTTSPAKLIFQLSGGSGDADLYVKYQAVPTSTIHDCGSSSKNNDEVCTFNAPEKGIYEVMVKASSAYSDMSLRFIKKK
ncbi:PPC domain-containing protein [Shewanella violacea]|uniref:Uncharacterized protein n=1 Tax=Shewanella violacea (strain JCM 10179 / CIP 106290 / LMG 19151 / DSS12) TaxID=637905 RepID=D4ZEX0_SHEVD|nr:PPC domain-containing protein [Shewanella violacea]BAJ00350.1 hypothetical protein SVI_0379 [Shewanella violacea DSS12]